MAETDTGAADLASRLQGLLRRRVWWILVPTCSIALLSVAVVFTLPNLYTSEATLLALQPQVSSRFVTPLAATSVGDSIQSLTRQVMSRTRLTGIIDEFHLYPKLRGRAPAEQIVEVMRRDIEIQTLDLSRARNDFNAFRVSFTADNAQVAHDVTSRLTTFFIEENLKTRETQATSTADFLAEQLVAARRKLADQEQKIRTFEMQNGDARPERQQLNLGTLSDLRVQLQTTSSSLSRAQQDRVSLESQLNVNLARLQAEKSALLVRFTARHQDVVKKDQEIANTQALIDRARANASGKASAEVGSVDPALTHIRDQVDANGVEIANLRREEDRIRGLIGQVQGRLGGAPALEQQLAAMNREYESLQQDVRDLQKRQLESQQMTSVEERGQGQQFRLADPPTLPLTPSSPQRPKLLLGGLAAGMGIGFLLAFFLESRDHSFHTEKALKQRYPVPLVVGVPLLFTPAESKSHNWRLAAGWMAGSFMVLVVMAAEWYVYRRG